MSDDLDWRIAIARVDGDIKGLGQSTRMAFAAAEKATDNAREAISKRFDTVNEFRGALADQQHTLLTRAEYDVHHRALQERVQRNYEELVGLREKLTELRSTTTGKAAGMSLLAGVVYSCIVGVASFVAIWAFVAPHFVK